MQELPPQITEPLERINRVYFSDPGRIIEIPAGQMLVGQGQECHRIFLILEGTMGAFHQSNTLDGTDLPVEMTARGYEVFRAGAGSYVCVQSFFSGMYRSSNYIIALEDCRVAYMDDTTPIVDEDIYGPAERQFLPIIVHELAARNNRIFTHSAEKEEAIRLLQRSEMAATLGQLSAGIAHELNNAVGVLARRTDFVAKSLWNYLEDDDKNNALLFSYGFEDTSYTPASELRNASRYYEREMGMSQEAAKVMAHIFPDTEDGRKMSSRFLKSVKKNYRFWELGHDLRDMKMASKLATGIVRAVKMLGGGNSTREPGVDIIQSLKDALNLLHNNLKRIKVVTEFQEVPTVTADITELVQIWTNIIKNAYDAMNQDGTENPCITITTNTLHVTNTLSMLPTEYVTVTIANNGPPIAPEHIDKIFNPNFTTKKLGMDFGLGLGLSIVRRVIDSYNAAIDVRSDERETAFTINIPTQEIHDSE